MRHLDLFSGIGGFALATERVWDNVEHIFCDNDPFSQAILKKHWPNSLIYGDIKELTQDRIASDTRREYGSAWGSERTERDTAKRSSAASKAERYTGIDLLTGGFPCQPFSAAGRRRGTEDNRHLWPEMLRVIRETHPTYIVGENVGGLLTWDGGMVFEQVCTDLEEAGYEVAPFVIPACAVNAPHRRDRVWIVAHAIGGNALGTPRQLRSSQESEWIPEWDEVGQPSQPNGIRIHSDPDSTRLEGKLENETEGQYRFARRAWRNERFDWNSNWHEVAAAFCRVDDGLPRRMDRTYRLKALGNAIVPQVAAEVMKSIRDLE